MHSKPHLPGTIIYNITMQVEKDIAADWLQWMLQQHVPGIMQYDVFTQFHIVKLLDIDEDQSLTYAIQFFTDDKEKLETYLHQYGKTMQQNITAKWGQGVMSFSTTMQVVH